MEPPLNFAQVKKPWLAPMMVPPTKPPLLPIPTRTIPHVKNLCLSHHHCLT